MMGNCTYGVKCIHKHPVAQAPVNALCSIGGLACHELLADLPRSCHVGTKLFSLFFNTLLKQSLLVCWLPKAGGKYLGLCMQGKTLTTV